MKQFTGWVTLFFVTILLACQSQQPNQSDKIQIAASIAPLADFARQVGGDHVNVYLVVPPGVNPHQFELTPRILKDLSKADLIILNGVGLEFWDKAVYALDNKNILDTSQGIEIFDRLDDAEHDHGHEHKSGGNPHIWLDPVRAMEQVKSIRDALTKMDPESADSYLASANNYLKLLKQLDDSLRTEIHTWQQKKFITFHPAWIYFAKRYGLEQAAVIEPAHGMEIGPQTIAEIIEITKNIKAGAIFTEAMFPDNLSKTIASECGIPTVPLDPLGGVAQIESYTQLLKYNVKQMAGVLNK